MSRNSSNDDARFGVEWLASKLGLPKTLHCLRLIADRGLEEKTEAAFTSFMDLLDRQPLSPQVKNRLKDSFVTALIQRFAVEELLLMHIRMCNGVDDIHRTSMYHYAEEAARKQFLLDCYGAGPQKKKGITQRRHEAMDEGWNAGFRDMADLFDFMKKNYPELIRTKNRFIAPNTMMKF